MAAVMMPIYGEETPETHYVARGSNPVTQSELMKALDELILQEKPMLQEDDLTINILMDRAKWNRAKAKAMLAKWQLEGKVEYLGKRATLTGHMMDAWRIKDI